MGYGMGNKINVKPYGSTDEKLQHKDCFEEQNSWCNFRKDKACFRTLTDSLKI